MSGENLEKKFVVDPRVNLSQGFRRWISFFGAKEVEVLETPASSGANSSSTNFDIKITDNTSVLIDRSSMLLAVPITITKTGPGTGTGLLFQSDCEGLRCRPLEKIMQNLSFKISSGSNVNYQPWQYTSIMEKFISNTSFKQETPTMIDRTQTYSTIYGRHMSPFAYRLDNEKNLTRSSYPIVVVTNTSTTAVLTTVLYLNLGDYPPFMEDQDVLGINCRPFTININWIPQLTRLWSMDLIHHTQPYSNINVTLGIPSLYCTVLTIPFKQQIPNLINYNYNEVVYYPKNTDGPIASGAKFQIVSEVIQFTSMPAKVYIGGKPSDSYVLNSIDASVGTPDVFAQINNVQLTLGNKTSYFANYSPVNLFDVTKNNGLDQTITWPDWWGLPGDAVPTSSSGNVPLMGSIFAIDPVKDMGSSKETITTGLSSNPWNFQAKVNFTNISPNALVYEFFILVVYEGVLTLKDRTMATSTTTIMNTTEGMTPLDVPYSQIKYLHGGKIGDFFKTAWGRIKPSLEVVNEGLKNTRAISKITKTLPIPGSRAISTVAKSLGYGEGEDDFYDEYGRCITNRPCLEDGAVLSRRKLQRAMSRYR